jgi:dienelactone hydrolase
VEAPPGSRAYFTAMRLLPSLIVVAGIAAVACGGQPTRATSLAPAFIQNGDVRLAYSIDLPQGRGPFPAVVLGHGSGRLTRDDLRFLSTRWVGLGFAVLRFDKRGVGESTGAYSGVGPANSHQMFRDLASDIVAAARFLRTRPEVDPKRVGLAGVSQAGWILPLAARELGDAAFVALLSGPVCSVGLENYYSDLVEFTTRPLAEVYPLLPAFNGPPGFDPVPILEHLDTPTLWLLGTEDRSIPVPTTIENLQKLRAAGRPFEWRTYEGLGHGLGPQIWDDIARWVGRFQ